MSVLLVALIVVVAPRHLLAWDTAGARVPDRAKAINDIRTTLLQGLAGVALLVGAFFTWRQLQVTRYGQLSERFTAAVEQLGSHQQHHLAPTAHRPVAPPARTAHFAWTASPAYGPCRARSSRPLDSTPPSAS
ncbi:hypothetical protein [Streptomyces sp. NPDC047525]|uniref:hypothetical protein n=1 Tax=Streptomyces sp. NPDC047525 TaxID=3155264 RepID=UPI003404E83D